MAPLPSGPTLNTMFPFCANNANQLVYKLLRAFPIVIRITKAPRVIERVDRFPIPSLWAKA